MDGQNGQAGQILVIDDSPLLLSLVQSTLGAVGWTDVTGAADGTSGLKVALEAPPRLILLDDVLPDLLPAAFCAALRAEPATAHVPVVVLRSGADSDADSLAKIASVVDSIAKPFSPDALVAVVSHILLKGSDHATSEAKSDLAASTRPLALTPAFGTMLDPPSAADPGALALAGDLAAIGISDILLLLQDTRQTGVLEASHDRARVRFYLRAGRLDFATAVGVAEEFLLGRFLIEGRFVAETELAKVLAETRAPAVGAAGNRRLGTVLLERALIDRPQLEEAMRRQTSALVFEVMRFARGRFAFDRTADFPDIARDATLSLSIDELLMEGLRRVDEWRIIEREVNDFDVIFVREDARLQALGRGKLLRDELFISSLVDGRVTVKEIVAQSKMGSFDVSKILFRLLRGKLIRRRVAPTVM